MASQLPLPTLCWYGRSFSRLLVRLAIHLLTCISTQALLTQIDPASRRMFQLQGRDDGLLLHELWAVVTQTTAHYSSFCDPRHSNFLLLQALVSGVSGYGSLLPFPFLRKPCIACASFMLCRLEHVVRRAFPAALHPSPEYPVHFDEYGRVAGYQVVGQPAACTRLGVPIFVEVPVHDQ